MWPGGDNGAMAANVEHFFVAQCPKLNYLETHPMKGAPYERHPYGNHYISNFDLARIS